MKLGRVGFRLNSKAESGSTHDLPALALPGEQRQS